MESYEGAGWLSQVFLLYLNPLIKLGSKKVLQVSDMGGCPSDLRSSFLRKKFDVEWEKQLQSAAPSLWMALWRTIGFFRLWVALTIYAVHAGLMYIPIMILKALVQHFSKVIHLTTTQLWIYVAGMFFVPAVSSIFAAQSNVMVAKFSIIMRNCLINKIYRKSLKLSPASKQVSSTGQIVNMFSTDTQMIAGSLNMLNNVRVCHSLLLPDISRVDENS